MSEDCKIKLCARDRGVDHCYECAGYPCARLVAFRNDECAHHSVVLKNQEAKREQGVGRWLEAQQARWSCPTCGRASSWYDKAYPGCGGALYNCEDEEADLPRG